jgi:catechol 2,3-dioxygenase
MTKLPEAQLSHFGLYAMDLDKMVDFYTRTLGLVITDRGLSGRGMAIVFLSANPDEHHQVAIAAGRPKEAVHSTINQMSFRVNGLEELRRYYDWLVKEKVQKLDPRDHGNAWSIYFHDPEGNRVEIYCPSPWYVSQPFGEPLDLTQPVESIMAKTQEMVKQDPTWRPIEVWSADMRKRIDEVHA